VAIDATDGWLARRLRVAERLPWFDGAKLDDIVDYLSYAFIPALVVWRVPLVPAAVALPVAAAILLSSAFGFNRRDAKTADHFFTGFPSYWNVVVLYLLVVSSPPAANAAILLTLVALVFVPFRYVYPSRTPILQPLTVTLGALWSVLVLAKLWRFPESPSPIVFWSSLVFPLYYVALSLVLHRRG